MSTIYCKAGFQHISLEDCEHVVMQTFGIAPRKKFELPADFYTDEALAQRREENQSRYRPKNAEGRRKVIMQSVNEARDYEDKRTF